MLNFQLFCCFNGPETFCLEVGCMDQKACAAAEGWHRDLEGEVAVSDVMESYDLDPVTAKAAGEMTNFVVMVDKCW